MQIKKEEATNISTIPIHFAVEYRAFISFLFSYCYCFNSRFQFSLRMWFSLIIITLNFGQSITIIISIRRDSTKMSTNIYYELGTWGNEIERLSPKTSHWSSIQSTSWLRSLKNFAFLRMPLRDIERKLSPPTRFSLGGSLGSNVPLETLSGFSCLFSWGVVIIWL